MGLTSAVQSGDRLALSRLLSQIEDDTPQGRAALEALFPHTGKAYLVGVTGAPGTGKSSLVNRLAYHYRHPPQGEEPQKVAVVAVDPTSPFTGGALLGDRIRMQDLAGDPGVFIRSMASRGALGGLAATTTGLVQAFDAGGFELIFIETVGAGQVEVDIASLAHTTLVVDAPGLGDDVQAIKAGILEIADVLVVNKADRPGADQALRALRTMLQLAHPAPRTFRHHNRIFEAVPAAGPAPSAQEGPAAWEPPIVATVSTEGKGISELAQAIEAHRRHLIDSAGWGRRERERLGTELDLRLQQALVSRWREQVDPESYRQVLEKLVSRAITPQEAVRALVDGKDTP
jgi:LAO/AO transport system kinase